MQVDALSSARPVSLEVRNSREIREAFDEISYAKGETSLILQNYVFFLRYRNTHEALRINDLKKFFIHYSICRLRYDFGFPTRVI